MPVSTRSSDVAVDGDGDSTMRSSPSLSGAEDHADVDEALEMLSGDEPHAAEPEPQPETATTNTITTALTSSRSNLMITRHTPGLNANGKRVHPAALSEADAREGRSAAAAGSGGGDMDGREQRVHEPSGYAWSREEDEPGYAWRTKRAQEEYTRAMEAVVARDVVVGLTYGDPVNVTLVSE